MWAYSMAVKLASCSVAQTVEVKDFQWAVSRVASKVSNWVVKKVVSTAESWADCLELLKVVQTGLPMVAHLLFRGLRQKAVKMEPR